MSTDVSLYKAGVPTLAAEQVRARATLVQQIMRGVMKAGTHYGTIPSTGDKPMLFKPGAETLAVTFRLAIEPIIDDLSTDDSVRYRVETRFTSQETGQYLGSGIGEASSDEEKYRWRKAVCDAEFDETPEDRRRVKWAKGKGGSTYQVNQVRTNPSDVANTILKMAKKRSQVDGTLTVTGASDIFGQDMEDLPEELRSEIVDAEEADAGEVIGPEDYQALLAEMQRTGLGEDAIAKNLAAKAGYSGPLDDMPVGVYEALMTGLAKMKTNQPKDDPDGGGGGAPTDTPDNSQSEDETFPQSPLETQPQDGLDDADCIPFGDAPGEPLAHTQPGSATAAAQRAAESHAEKVNGRVINQKQVNLLFTKCTIHGVDEHEQLHAWLRENIGVEHVADIPAARLDEVLAWVQGHEKGGR